MTKAEWVEEVFWAASGVLKHGGVEFFPRRLQRALANNRGLVSKLWSIRGVRIDTLHCIREQLIAEANIPAIAQRMWPHRPESFQPCGRCMACITSSQEACEHR